MQKIFDQNKKSHIFLDLSHDVYYPKQIFLIDKPTVIQFKVNLVMLQKTFFFTPVII